jgi:uracil-DNA glycosylase
MKMCDHIKCMNFPCTDVLHTSYLVPDANIDPVAIRLMMISEGPPNSAADYFYAAGNPFYLQTTLQAFNDAGFPFTSMNDILNAGVYITTAVKCAKTAYAISSETISYCSSLLETELKLFPNVRAIMLNGDVAI